MEANQRSRRGFLRTALAAAGAITAAALFQATPAKADGPEGYRDRWRFVPRPSRTPVGPTPSGVPGVSYFKAGSLDGRTLRDRGLAVYFNGRDVMTEAFECDLVGQWVGLWTAAERNPDGTVSRWVRLPDGRRGSHYAYGRVELRPVSKSTPAPLSPRPFEDRSVTIRVPIDPPAARRILAGGAQ